jgi:hypothetical protein
LFPDVLVCCLLARTPSSRSVWPQTKSAASGQLQCSNVLSYHSSATRDKATRGSNMIMQESRGDATLPHTAHAGAAN